MTKYVIVNTDGGDEAEVYLEYTSHIDLGDYALAYTGDVTKARLFNSPMSAKNYKRRHHMRGDKVKAVEVPERR